MKIDKNIPITTRLNSTKFLLGFEVGDSFFDEGETIKTSRIYMAARKMKKRHGMQFSARTEENGIRIWRTA